MNRRHLPVFLLLLVSAATAQESDSLLPPAESLGIIDTVIVAGNSKTESYVILNEMTLKPGVTASSEAMEYDRQRVYSLGLFTRVNLFYDSLAGTRFLLVDVKERWHILPYPILGFREGDPKKVFYGAGLLHNNFRGRNQKLSLSLVLGYDPSVSFSFHDPLLDHAHRLFFSSTLSTSRIRNKSRLALTPSGDFFERHAMVSATIGKRFNLYQTAGLTLGYYIVSLSDYRPGRTASPSGRDQFIFATLAYVYDSRDLNEYATRGSYHSLSLAKNGFGESDVSYAQWRIDLRRYVPLPFDFSVATRVHTTMLAGSLIPTYGRQYFGYGERIRGSWNSVQEGENIAGGTIELRYPLVKAQTIVFTAVPIPEEFAIWRLGVNLALFADAGAAWFPNDRLTIGSFRSGYGGGIHFLLPYSYVVRLEYAWNEYFRGQVILDLKGSI